jgi:hypothetical protein
MFVEAIAVEPSFALAHAALADVCSFLFQWRGRCPEHLTVALSASGRALELRPELAEVHAARPAGPRHVFDWPDVMIIRHASWKSLARACALSYAFLAR